MASTQKVETLVSRCPICQTTTKLVQCSACLVMPYCGKDHQAAHRERHKKECTRIRKCRKVVADEEQKLREHSGDMFMSANPFETGVGHFWGILETRPCMKARFAFVEAIVKIDTRNAVQLALETLLDMLRLCRSDNMGVRDLVPALYIRLGLDQQAYDFLTWYSTTGELSDFDWGDMNLGFLDIHDADLFEDPELFCHRFGQLSQQVAVILLKIRLLLDLQSLQHSSAVADKVPQEVLDIIRGQLVGNVVALKKHVMERTDQVEDIKDLEKQITKLFSGTFNQQTLLARSSRSWELSHDATGCLQQRQS